MGRMRRVAIVYSGDREARERATPENNRYSTVFEEFRRRGIAAEPAVYADDFADEVRRQLEGVDGVLVWIDPLQGGRDRSVLDAVLRAVASAGVFVSTHPDVILKMGTKGVLFDTREMGWSGGEIHRYGTGEELRQGLAGRLAGGASRVLKQNRGNGGNGVWRVALAGPDGDGGPDPLVRAIHALRGSRDGEMRLSAFVAQCEGYFEGAGQVIDQPFHSPVPGGMVRCYMTHNEVVGFGHQYVTALVYPEKGGEPLLPPPRLYHPPTKPEFQSLRARMEGEWIPQMQHILDIATEALPVIWDADFLHRQPAAGEDAHVLCEINVSCVSPFPDAALPKLVEATARRLSG